MPQDKNHLKMPLTLKSMVLGYELDAMERYILDSAENIKKLEQSLLDKFTAMENQHETAAQDFFERFEDEFMHYRDYYPDIFHKSMFLTQYSLFEVQMAELCGLLHNNDENIDLPDPKENDYLLRYWRWLRNIFGLGLNDLSDEFNMIKIYQQLRNKLMHSGGNIISKIGSPIEAQPLYQSVTANPYLAFRGNTSTFHITSNKFLLEFNKLIRKFLGEIMQRAEAKL